LQKNTDNNNSNNLQLMIGRLYIPVFKESETVATVINKDEFLIDHRCLNRLIGFKKTF